MYASWTAGGKGHWFGSLLLRSPTSPSPTSPTPSPSISASSSSPSPSITRLGSSSGITIHSWHGGVGGREGADESRTLATQGSEFEATVGWPQLNTLNSKRPHWRQGPDASISRAIWVLGFGSKSWSIESPVSFISSEVYQAYQLQWITWAECAHTSLDLWLYIGHWLSFFGRPTWCLGLGGSSGLLGGRPFLFPGRTTSGLIRCWTPVRIGQCIKSLVLKWKVLTKVMANDDSTWIWDCVWCQVVFIEHKLSWRDEWLTCRKNKN